MRAVTADFVNRSDSPRISEIDQPTISDDDVLVQISYAGMNAADWQYSQGMVKTIPAADLNIMGFEAAGVVASVGRNVTGFREGDRIMFARTRTTGESGTFAEYVAVPANLACRVPDWMSMTEAAATPICFLTSYIALFADDLGNAKPGQKVLIHGGSGGVGSFAIQLAKYGGLSVAATGRAANRDYMIEMGADLAIDYTDQEKGIVAQTREWAPGGVDIVFDAVRQNTLPDALEALKPGGTLVSIATTLDTSNLEEQMRASHARGFRHVMCFAHWPDRLEKLPIVNILECQGIRIPPVEVVELADLQSAIGRLKSGHTRGKLVLKMAGE
ncbi:NADP-dependent oxidoreductase [Rhizorhapis suberifaciens]|uniref:NADPH2:quinone reductase n=1 Tax=Rhizorhapis suberifaciens TaxID=13656 RepID=A0A840HZC7_9SPHN|nr:NADP-dependent oxidoreductase [Rhizorhapis suberifaciens]MBB4642920.1 NADPH2:quinone reductase [Rhizorhapis suberifaciens]